MGWIIAVGVVLVLIAGWRGNRWEKAQKAAGVESPDSTDAPDSILHLGLLGVGLVVLAIIGWVSSGAAALMLVAGVLAAVVLGVMAVRRARQHQRVWRGWFAPTAVIAALVIGSLGTDAGTPSADTIAAEERSSATPSPAASDDAETASLSPSPSARPTSAASPTPVSSPGASSPTAVKKPRPKKKKAAATGAGPYAVIRVVDGDTFHVNVGGRDTTVRIIGIDTPETKDPRKPVQCFGRQASNKAHQLLDGKSVYLVADPTQDSIDKYGRRLGYVTVSGFDYGKWMISHGYAHEYTYDLPYQRQAAYKAAQRYADAHNLGFWSPSTCGGNTTQGVDKPKPKPAPAPAKKQPPTSGGGGGGATEDGIDKDCGDFDTHNGAQNYFKSQGGSPSNNVDRLDRDGDGIACESLP